MHRKLSGFERHIDRSVAVLLRIIYDHIKYVSLILTLIVVDESVAMRPWYKSHVGIFITAATHSFARDFDRIDVYSTGGSDEARL